MTKVIQICRAYPIMDEKLEPIKELGYQLLFTNADKEWLKEWEKDKNPWARYVLQQKADDIRSAESNTVRAFEKKYNVECQWGEVDTGKSKWFCYRIKES